MAFERRTWYQRLGQGLNKFLIGEKDAEGKQELTNAPDSITQQGDVISADNLNDLEGRIQSAFVDVELVKVWENSDPTSSFSAQTITLSGEIAELCIEYTEHERSTKFLRIRPYSNGAYSGLSLMGINESFDNTDGSVALNYRPITPYYYQGNTHIIFSNERTILWTFVSGSGSGNPSVSTLNNRMIPVAIYSIGGTLNS